MVNDGDAQSSATGLNPSGRRPILEMDARESAVPGDCASKTLVAIVLLQYGEPQQPEQQRPGI